MPIVQIEHPIKDYETWKRAFDSDPAHREASGVRRYHVYRPIEDSHYVAVDLEFGTRAEADAFKAAIERVWQSPQAKAALGGAPRARVVDVVESRSFSP